VSVNINTLNPSRCQEPFLSSIKSVCPLVRLVPLEISRDLLTAGPPHDKHTTDLERFRFAKSSFVNIC
jgi:hypothetical protein